MQDRCPFLRFTTVNDAAMQLHQTCHSLRPQDQRVLRRLRRGRNCRSLRGARSRLWFGALEPSVSGRRQGSNFRDARWHSSRSAPVVRVVWAHLHHDCANAGKTDDAARGAFWIGLFHLLANGTSQAGGCFEPSLPNVVPQQFAGAVNPACCAWLLPDDVAPCSQSSLR